MDLRRLNLVMLFMGLAFLPSGSPLPFLEVFDAKRLFQILIFLSVALHVALERREAFRLEALWELTTWKTRLLLSLVVMAGALSALLAANPNYAFIEFATFLLLGLTTAYIASGGAPSFDFFRRVLLPIVMAGFLLYALRWGIYHFAYLADKGRAPDPVFTLSGFSNIRFFNQWEIWWLAPMVALAGRSLPQSAVIRSFATITAALMFAMLIASYSLGAVLATVLPILGFLAVRGMPRRFALRMIAFCLAGLVIHAGSVFLFSGDLAALEPQTLRDQLHDQPRLLLWRLAAQAFLDSPWLGMGPMHFALIPNPVAAHPHNSVLQMASEWGGVATIAIAALALMLLRHVAGCLLPGSRAPSPSDNNGELPIALFFSLLAGTIYSGVSGVIVTPLSQLSLAACTGFLLAHCLPRSGAVSQPPARRLHAWAPRLAALSALLLLIVPVRSDVALRFDRYPEGLTINYATPGPRYWQFTDLRPQGPRTMVDFSQALPNNQSHNRTGQRTENP